MSFKRCKCYFCKEYIENECDKVRDYFGYKNKVNLHKSCVSELEKSREEKRAFDEVYDYIRFEIMNYSKEQQLSPSMRNKIMSIRMGKLVVRGQTMKESHGYSYDIILRTLKFIKPLFIRGIVGKQFEDDNHKFNYAMVILMNNINDIYKRIEQKKKSEEITKQREVIIDTKDKTEEYKEIKKEKKKENKVASLFSDLF